MKQILVMLCIFAVSYNFGLIKARPSPEDESDLNIGISEDAAYNETKWKWSDNDMVLISDDAATTENPGTENNVTSLNEDVSSDDKDVCDDTLDSDEEKDTDDISEWKFLAKEIERIFAVGSKKRNA
uniref:Secreted protein n=1 Tax=Biomphalaria glabrata TaxID=6526 RepID=A0A2C9L1B2_BIOGL